jgi:hypothetical protein
VSDADPTSSRPEDSEPSTDAYPDPRPAPYGSSPYAIGPVPWNPLPEPVPRPLVEMADVWTTLLGTVGVLVVGVLASVVWVWLAPRVMAVRDAKGGVSLVDGSTKAFAGADVWFLFVTAAAGVLCGLIAAVVARHRGLAVSVAMAVGGIAAALLTAFLGRMFTGGPLLYWASHVATGNHRLFIQLSTRQYLVAWPMAALAVTFVVALLTPDPPVQPEIVEPPPARHDVTA